MQSFESSKIKMGLFHLSRPWGDTCQVNVPVFLLTLFLIGIAGVYGTCASHMYEAKSARTRPGCSRCGRRVQPRGTGFQRAGTMQSAIPSVCAGDHQPSGYRTFARSGSGAGLCVIISRVIYAVARVRPFALRTPAMHMRAPACGSPTYRSSSR